SPGAEDRLASFTELVATAIANNQAHESLEQLAEEQAALRRVATLVARGPGPEPVFRAVAAEVSALMDAEAAAIVRFEDDGKRTVMAGAERGNRPGERVNLDLDYIVASVRETRRAARFDTDDPAAAGMPELVRSVGIRSVVATPVIVEGKLWGAITIASFGRSLAPGTERRLVDFTDLVETAVANTQAREQVATLADEQAALRRLATLVVKGVEADKLFSSVVAEVARLLGASAAQLDRYEPDGTTVIIASFHELDWQTLDSELPVGKQWSPGPASLTAAVRETGRAARVDDYTDVRGEIGEIARAAGIGSACGAPISVDGALWGAIRVLAQLGIALPPDRGARLEAFREIVATAVSNAAARAALRDLAREQAALHRVAALVAEGADSSIVFEAVCEEAVKLFGAANVNLSHYTPDGFNVSVAGWSADGRNMPKGGRWPLTPDTIGGQV